MYVDIVYFIKSDVNIASELCFYYPRFVYRTNSYERLKTTFHSDAQ